MISITINEKQYRVQKNLTILQACENVGLTIPYFCYNEALEIAGNCRMCLVEVKTVLKPVAACAVHVTENMQINLNSALVQKVRENVLEFLLINHPLDCPICDQGGECDLQEQSYIFGSDRTRFFLFKRGVSDIFVNSVVKGIMSRCIHCTRCVRFSTNVAKLGFFGTIGRGNDTVIDTYVSSQFNTEFSGNVIDLCPVGALTSRPFGFRGRSWELKTYKHLDSFDIFGKKINIVFKNNKIVRVLPFKNSTQSTDWLSDRTRFSYDSYALQRLDLPLYKSSTNLIKISWKSLLENFSMQFKYYGPFVGIAGENTDIKTLQIFKIFLNSLGSSELYLDTDKNIKVNQDLQQNYLSYDLVSDTNTVDYIIIINVDLRFEASAYYFKILNLLKVNPELKLITFGTALNYSCNNSQHFGWNSELFLTLLEGKTKLSKELFKAKNIKFFMPTDVQYGSIIKKYLKNAEINFLNSFLYEPGAYDLGINTSLMRDVAIKRAQTLILLNANRLKITDSSKNIIFIGSQSYGSIQNASVILPATTILEKDVSYINNFGISCKATKCMQSLQTIRTEFQILSVLAILLKLPVKQNILSLNIELPENFNKKVNTLQVSVTRKVSVCLTNLEKNVRSFFLYSNFHKLSKLMHTCAMKTKIHTNSFRNLKKFN